MATFRKFLDDGFLKVQTPIERWGDKFFITVDADRHGNPIALTPRQALEMALFIMDELGKYKYFEDGLI